MPSKVGTYLSYVGIRYTHLLYAIRLAYGVNRPPGLKFASIVFLSFPFSLGECTNRRLDKADQEAY